MSTESSLGLSGNLHVKGDSLVADAFNRPPADYQCERCWMEWATEPAPPGSGLTFVCGDCASVLLDTSVLAQAVNHGKRSGVQ